METRVYPDNSKLTLIEYDGGRQRQQFVLERCIGQGASCVAYRAVAENGAPVKLKQFCPRALERGSTGYTMAEQRFLNAYRQQLGMLQDERISNITASLFHLYRGTDGSLWTSVNDVVGRTLDKLLHNCTLHSAAAILRRVAESLRAYHQSGWLLLDLKPENILVIDSPGISGVNFFDFDSFLPMRELQYAIEHGQPLLLSSSPAFSAPELQSHPIDIREIGPSADRYSVGAILFFAVFGHPPAYFDCLPGMEYEFTAVPEERGRELTAAVRGAISDILRRTLTFSPVERFGDDDELLHAIDTLLRLTDRGRPYLSHRMPSPVETYVGREAERKRLTQLLKEKKSPIFVCGIGGIGKTELVLKTAESYDGGDLDFYYIDFKGSVRETILSLPVENLPRTRLNAQGIESEVPGDEFYAAILRCLRESCGKNTVLIVDNFDAPDDSKTPELRQEAEYQDLLALPLRLLFTTRCRFDDACCMPVENLAEQELLSLMRQYLPAETNDEPLRQILRAVGGHTLTVDIVARTLRESKGTLSAEKMLRRLMQSTPGANAAPGLAEQLRTVFRVANFEDKARTVLACACLFPLRGIDSRILFTVLDAEHWGTANRLERSGWLHYDDYSRSWSMHPLVRMICEQNRGTMPARERTAPFINTLKAHEAELLTGEDAAYLNRQITEVYANYVRCAIDLSPIPWYRRWYSVAALALVVLATALTALLFRPEKAIWTELSVYAPVSASVSELAHDRAILLGRLAAFLNHEAEIREQTEQDLCLRFSLSQIEQPEDLDIALRYFLLQPDETYFFFTSPEGDEVYKPLTHGSILSISPETLSAEILEAQSFPEELAAGAPCLLLTLDEAAAQQVNTLIDSGEEPTLCCDPNEDEAFWQAFLLPAGESGRFYLVDPEIQTAELYRLIAYSLTHETLSASMLHSCRFEPDAVWEERGSAVSWGKYQCAPSALDGELVRVYLGPNNGSGKFISDFSFGQILQTVKRRLDLIGQPYAIGYDHIRERGLVILTGAEKVNVDILKLLVRSDFQFATRYYCQDALLSAPSHVELREEDGLYRLALRYGGEHSGDRQALRRWTAELIAQGEHSIYLEQDGYLLAEAKISRPVMDGTLVFDALPFLGEESVTEERGYILQLLAQTLGSKAQLSDFYYGYSVEDWQLLNGAVFGLQRSTAEDEACAAAIRALYPDAEIYRDPTAENYHLCINLNLTPGPTLVPDFLEAVQRLFTETPLDASMYDSIQLYPRLETESFRFCYLTAPSLIDGGPERRFNDQSFRLRGDAELYRDQLEKALEELPFFEGAELV